MEVSVTSRHMWEEGQAVCSETGQWCCRRPVLLPIYSGIACWFVVLYTLNSYWNPAHSYWLSKLCARSLKVVPLSRWRLVWTWPQHRCLPMEILYQQQSCEGLPRQAFLWAPKPPKLPQKKQIPLIRILKCQCFAMSLPTGVSVST